jgi:hypothetical protein
MGCVAHSATATGGFFKTRPVAVPLCGTRLAAARPAERGDYKLADAQLPPHSSASTRKLTFLIFAAAQTFITSITRW